MNSRDAVNHVSTLIRQKINKYPNLVCGVYIKPSQANSEININGDSIFPAASLIKLPVAVALLIEIDKKNLSWGKELVLKRNHYASGAGVLRTKKAGTKISLKEVFKLMLTISDNTATNMIIDLLGGINAANVKISKLGLKNTRLVNYLGDFKGTNKTTPKDLVTLLDKALEGDLLSKSSRKHLKKTLLSVENTSLIKKSIGKFTRFAHKTGTIGICIGDAGIIYSPFSKKVGIAVIVKRPFNSLLGKKVIWEISSIVKEDLI